MKRIEELQKVKGDAYDYYYMQNADTDLFERIFIVDEVVNDIKDPYKYFLIGEKGSGKTAYTVYLSKNQDLGVSCSIKLVENTLYRKFLNMKQQKMLELSEFKDVWINLLYLIIAEDIRAKDLVDSILPIKKYHKLTKAIDVFYSDAFKPELVNALEFIDNASSSINTMISQGVFSGGSEHGREKQKKYTEQSYQISLMKIRSGFEAVFSEMKLKRPYIVFIDGVDARPVGIDNEQYFECITELINAVLEINQTVLGPIGIKVMPLMRPDVMFRMPIHNLNQKIRENSVLLSWITSYRDYVQSKLFRLADNFFAKQQDQLYELAECWNHYFPYEVEGDSGDKENPFFEFLRYSTYKPRDILTMLNEMVEATSGESFTQDDFDRMLSNYTNYLKGELKDYLLVYMNEDDYNNFLLLFDQFIGLSRFDYEAFNEKHLAYLKYLKELGRLAPAGLQTGAEALQLLYDANIICCQDNGTVYWSYSERNYANMKPEVRKGGQYAFSMAYAKAFRII